MTKLITKHPVVALVLIWAALIGVMSMPWGCCLLETLPWEMVSAILGTPSGSIGPLESLTTVTDQAAHAEEYVSSTENSPEEREYEERELEALTDHRGLRKAERPSTEKIAGGAG